MQFTSEGAFRDWVQSELAMLLESEDTGYVVLRSKNVNDIVVCRERPSAPFAAFIEVKYAKASSGRIGVGDGKGGGFQPEILIRKPVYFEHYTRWLVASELGVAVLVDCNLIRRYAVGAEFRSGKQNNIRPDLISARNGAFAIDASPLRIAEWLRSIRIGAARHPLAADGAE